MPNAGRPSGTGASVAAYTLLLAAVLLGGGRLRDLGGSGGVAHLSLILGSRKAYEMSTMRFTVR